MGTKLYGQEEKVIFSKIVMEKKDNFIILRPRIQNAGMIHEGELSYVFLALKKTKHKGYSSNKQQGEFSLKPKEGLFLSQLRINLSKEEELKSYLFIRRKGRLVTKDSLFINVLEDKLQKVKNNEQAFFIKGIVVDEAITKVGKDFHDIFYQQYLLGGKKYPFVIKIKEKPGMGRSSVISAEVEDEKLYEFFAKPNEEFLQQQAKILLSILFNYNAKRRKILKRSKLY